MEIAPLTDTLAIRTRLRDLLIETVAHNGSVHFRHPLATHDADAFWDASLAAMARGERIILGAFDGGELVSTVTLQLFCPPNQPHRGEIAKMMTRVSHRGRGAGAALLREAERLAAAHGRTLLVLDTAAEDGASAFYEKSGYTLAGAIPGYAYTPHGVLSATRIYWKRLDG